MFFSILTPSYFFFFIYLFVVIKPENPYLASRSGLGVNSLGVYPLGPRTSSCGLGAWFRTTAKHSPREREKFIIRQPPIGGKDDYDSENSWISDGLPSSSRRRRRGDGRGEGGECREVKCKRGHRWRRRRQTRDQGREKLQPGMKHRGFRWECHPKYRHRHRCRREREKTWSLL